MRSIFTSSGNVPPIQMNVIERRIHEEASTTIPTIGAERLADVYHISTKTGAPPHEVAIVVKSLRARLRLPDREETMTSHELSDPGRRVWQRIFSDTPQTPPY